MSGKKQKKRVVIVQRRMTAYRIRLFELMRDKLALDGIELSLLVGLGTQAEEMKRDGAYLDWAVKVPTRYFLGDRLCWQPFASHSREADLVIVTQENKLLCNLLAMTIQRPERLAFWGHGANLQSANPRGIKERFKRWSAMRADWWFGYTRGTTLRLQQYGFAADRITALENAVDTRQLMRFRDELIEEEVSDCRVKLGITNGPVGIYVGSFYADKRLEFLFAAADMIRQQLPDFRLVLVGDGPMREEVKLLCAARGDWCQWVGSQHGRDKVLHLLAADIVLTPAAVGLAILDSFVVGRPLLTTSFPGHGPEIDYLEHDFNGLITSPSVPDYAAAAIKVLSDRQMLHRLADGCLKSAGRYTIENMADNFCRGIKQALST